MNMDRWIDKINESHATIDYADYSELIDLVVELKAENESLKNSKRMPITKFNSDEELQACLEWWQAKLGLQDWIIKGVLSDMKDDDETAGRCIHIPTEKVALIKINSNMSFIELHEHRIMKSPMELTLVHELLHARISVLENKEGTYEAKLAEAFEHTLIEDMAKALIMTKYNIGLDYFRNF